VPSVTDSSFARRLTQLREAAGLSQYEVAKRAGLTRQTLSRLEMGESVPTWPTVQLLAAALGVDCTAFVDPALQPPAAEPSRKAGRPRKDADAAPSAKPAAAAKAKKAGGTLAKALPKKADTGTPAAAKGSTAKRRRKT
jgi:transcriptional regulator with XRE-family HTH domain